MTTYKVGYFVGSLPCMPAPRDLHEGRARAAVAGIHTDAATRTVRVHPGWGQPEQILARAAFVISSAHGKKRIS